MCKITLLSLKYNYFFIGVLIMARLIVLGLYFFRLGIFGGFALGGVFLLLILALSCCGYCFLIDI